MLTGFASVATAVEAIKLGPRTTCPNRPMRTRSSPPSIAAGGDPGAQVSSQPLSVDRLEWEHIQKILSENTGNVSATARALNMHRRTLQRKLGKKPSRS